MTPALTLSVAPMMDRTDRHFRYLMRLITPHARLYTEMITTSAVLHGDRERLLAFDASEHPLAIQLGGNDPRALYEAARIATVAGFDEINLNVGCPSSRVQAGAFGAALMLEPVLVADCVAAMREAGPVPVTVKTRIGVDEHDDYAVLCGLTRRVVAAGVSGLIVHARKAWLKGLSPKQNREIPPLDYARVHRLKAEFPDLPIEINGGFTDVEQVLTQAGLVDGVMLGRGAYDEPMLMARLDQRINGMLMLPAEADILAAYGAYMRREIESGTPLTAMTRHLAGLFRHRPGARRWRRRLSELMASRPGIDALLAELTSMPTRTRYNADSAGEAVFN